MAALGFVTAGTHALWPSRIPYAAGVHVWAVGAIGVMTLAMMTRATLGHSGRALVASKGTQFAYLCVVAALIARVAMALAPEFAMPLLIVASGAWIFALRRISGCLRTDARPPKRTLVEFDAILLEERMEGREEFPKDSVPALMLVVPVYVLLPLRTNVPAPSLVRPPPPPPSRRVLADCDALAVSVDVCPAALDESIGQAAHKGTTCRRSL